MSPVIAPAAASPPAAIMAQGRWPALRPLATPTSFRSLYAQDFEALGRASDLRMAARPFAALALCHAPLPSRAAASFASMRAAAEAASQRRGQTTDQEDPLDPMHRHRAALAAPEALGTPSTFMAMQAAPNAEPSSAARFAGRAAASLEDLVPALVRRIAWSGDRHRGTVRLELGAGELAGAILLVQAEGGHVRVHMDVPAGVDAHRWQERIRHRLASRGVRLDAVEVT